MPSNSVPLASVALSPNIAGIPMAERTLVKFDEELDYQHVLRSDMLVSLHEVDWMLMPTSETLNKVARLSKRNFRAKVSSRVNILEAFSAEEHEYELRYMRVCDDAKQPTIYIDTGDAAPGAFEYPYHGLPKVTSRAHPLFIIYMVNRATLDGIHPINDRDLKAMHIATGNVARLWLNDPPSEFKYGHELPIEHRHPISVAGFSEGDLETQHTPTTILGKRKREPSDGEGSPRLTSRALAFVPADRLYDDATALRAWVGGIEPGHPSLRPTSPSLTEGSALPPLSDEADAALAQYALESFRPPLHVMRTGRRLPVISFPIYQEQDTSRFTSSQWAEWKFHVILWGYRESSK
ncbi:hypothetical protein EV714DRAFT_280643 [Schizophyllum commune]